MIMKRSILFVDDEPSILAAFRRLLRREGYDLLTASSGADAIEQLEERPVQLIICDHRMPGMTGVELLREVRQRWPDTIRIILSGYSDASTIIDAINEGEIYKFITKPWNDEEIKLHLQRALELQELKGANARMAREIANQNEQLRELNALLEQRASDASTGLTSTQALLEDVGVGIFTVDPAGLILGANRLASEIISPDHSALIGLTARTTLPDSLNALIVLMESVDNSVLTTKIDLDGRKIQCRINPVVAKGDRRGCVVAMWEEVA